MAVNKVESLLEGIRKAFNKRDTKEEELKRKEEGLTIEISAITRNIEGLSYKALIEEDIESKKEYETLEKERDKKALELDKVKKQIRALGKFEVGIDTRKQALDIYKGIKGEMEVKTKELDRKTNEYYKAKVELEKKAREIKDLHTEIGKLPIGLNEVTDFIEPTDIGKTEEDIRYFKDNLGRESTRVQFFDIDMFENRNKGLSREDINQLLGGTIYIHPQRKQ